MAGRWIVWSLDRFGYEVPSRAGRLAAVSHHVQLPDEMEHNGGDTVLGGISFPARDAELSSSPSQTLLQGLQVRHCDRSRVKSVIDCSDDLGPYRVLGESGVVEASLPRSERVPCPRTLVPVPAARGRLRDRVTSWEPQAAPLLGTA